MILVTVLGSSVLALLLALVSLEVGLRLFLPQPLGVSYRGEDSFPIHRPGHEFRNRTDEFDVQTRFNSMGLRDREYDREKVDGVYRILVLGDSITEALQVRDDEVYTEILEASLNYLHSGGRYEVINAGVSGFGTGDQLKMWEKLGEGLQPDLVIVQMSLINDLSENLFCRWYRTVNGAVEPTKPPAGNRWAGLEDELGSRFHSAQFIRGLARRTLGKEHERLENIYLHKTEKYHPFLYRKVGTRADFTEDWEVTFAYLRELVERVKGAGADFLLLIRPLDPDVRGIRRDPYPRDILFEFCDQNEIDRLDLTPVFHERSGGELSSFRFRKDSHWHAEGHRWAAEALIERLREDFLSHDEHGSGDI